MKDHFHFTTPDNPALTGLPQIRMLCHSRHRHAKPLPDHLNDGIEICCAVQGSFSWEIKGKRVTIQKKEISITLPWEIHSGFEDTINRGELAFIIIKPSLFTQQGRLELGRWSRLPRCFQMELGRKLVHLKNPNIGIVPGVVDCLDGLGEELILRRECHQIRAHAILDDLLLRIGRHLNKPDTEKPLIPSSVNTALAALDSNITHPWTLSEIKAIAKCKVTALTRYFKLQTGMSPHQYIVSKRIELAKTRLCHTNDSLTQISYALGFGSSQHFSDVFKKWTGTSPSHYRKTRQD